MRKCKICQSELLSWIEIDGIKRNIQSRKYCLKCSPFGKHNTKQLHILSSIQIGKKVCPRCFVEKDKVDFYLRRQGTDLSSYCKNCSLDEVRERQLLFKMECLKYKG